MADVVGWRRGVVDVDDACHRVSSSDDAATGYQGTHTHVVSVTRCCGAGEAPWGESHTDEQARTRAVDAPRRVA